MKVEGLSLHALRATAAANALENEADIAFVQGVAGPREHRYDQALRPQAFSATPPTYEISY